MVLDITHTITEPRWPFQTNFAIHLIVTDLIANMETILDPNNNVINKLWCISTFNIIMWWGMEKFYPVSNAGSILNGAFKLCFK